ncbi:MAG: glycoside hydrolase family 127 protein [Bacteroidetes bacterium]|nr:MAG: glycoside hydrolase family 127 protein [Bacteroidota bacterium]
MKHIILLLTLHLLVSSRGLAQAGENTTPNSSYGIQAIPFTEVSLQDQFWKPRIETVQQVTIPHILKQLEETGRIRNFEIAAGSQTGGFCSAYPFDDSDVYKTIEGASYSLQTKPDPALEAILDTLIAKIAAAQEPDGYLYCWRTIHEKGSGGSDATGGRGGSWAGAERWMKTDGLSHELYNLGHLYEAAVAHHLATGKNNLLDIAIKSADLVDQTFGWGKLEKAPGHQEIELGLAKLYRLTGNKRYLDLAKFFLDVRGYGDPYMQNHKKVTEQDAVVGHAVRACYMYSAMADVAALADADDYIPALLQLWHEVIAGKVYLTGGIGSAGSNEGFTEAYDLPNFSAYCETCSSIAFALWNQRMFQLSGDAKYIDVFERTLYNALNAGMSLNGDRFFYPNPLESRKNVERSPWFTCACCPPNVARFFTSLPGYVYAQQGNTVYVNLFTSSETTVTNINSRLQFVPVKLRQTTNYPWSGIVTIEVTPQKPNTFQLNIRIPGWARGDAFPGELYSFTNKDEDNISIKVNGKTTFFSIRNGYAEIERKWKKGDVVEVALPMHIHQVRAQESVEADAGRIALQRGPIVYCLEGRDQEDERVLNLMVRSDAPVSTQFEPELLGGIQTLSLTGALVEKKTGPMDADLKPVRLKAIPYYAWANRGKDYMAVWLPNEVQSARPVAQPTLASTSKATGSVGFKGELTAVSDQWIPNDAADKGNPIVHWWPKFGTTEWLQYEFKRPEQVGTVRIYWFDDEATGGGCRIPKKRRVLYFDNGEWRPVYVPEPTDVVKDGWDEINFEPVNTKALRLEFELQEGVSAGVHEWEVK